MRKCTQCNKRKVDVRFAELPVNLPKPDPEIKDPAPVVQFVPDYSSQQRQRILRARIR